MREIKFRAWDKELECMVRVDKLAWFYAPHEITSVNNGDTDIYVLMQYTGLKDRNGKEIYEGDIVKGWTPDSEVDRDLVRPAVIKFDDAAFSVFIGKNFISDLVSCTLNKSLRVVGNVYENPELLENKPQT